MITELPNKFNDLDRAMQIAAKCRFKASRRLRSHKQIAQVIIAIQPEGLAKRSAFYRLRTP
jgi:hypothetical protein